MNSLKKITPTGNKKKVILFICSFYACLYIYVKVLLTGVLLHSDYLFPLELVHAFKCMCARMRIGVCLYASMNLSFD